jgi:hypothetical protein
MSISRKVLLIITIAAITFGIFLRLYYGLSTDLWGDEVISFFLAKDTSWFDLFFSGPSYWDKVHPPLYYILLKFVLTFTKSDVFLRAISLFWFAPSLYMIWLIGIKTSSYKQTLFAISLFSLHPLLINLSFQVRPYSLAIFLILFSIYLLVMQIEKPNVKNGVFLGLFLGLSFLTSYASIWLIVSIILWLGLQVYKRGWQFLMNFYPTLTALILLSLFQIFHLLFTTSIDFFSGLAIASSVYLFTWQWFLQEMGLLTGLKVEFLSLFIMLIIPIVFLRRNRKKIDYFLIIIFLASILLSVISSIFFSPIFLARQLVVVTIALIFIIARLITNVRTALFSLLILCVYAYLSYQTYGFLFQTNINEKVQQHVKNGDVILLFEGNYDYLSYYLFVNNKQAEVQVLSTDQIFNQNLLAGIKKSNSRLLFFNHFCPEEKYEECRRLVEELRVEYCDNIYCQTIE